MPEKRIRLPLCQDETAAEFTAAAAQPVETACRVFGRAEIKATVVGERREFHITFDLCGVQIERDGLLEIAERSGFEVEIIDEYKIRLSTPVKRTHALRVYAGDADAISRALYTVFFINFE